MKKKLKVKKAFSGSMMNAARRMVRPGTPIRQSIQDLDLKEANPRFPRGPIPSTIINPVRPGMQQPIKNLSNVNISPYAIDPVRPDMQMQQQPIRNINDMGPINVSPFNSTPAGVRGGMGPLPNNLGPTQQPNPSGNIFGIMSQRQPQSQQPVQPVPAMKKGGSVIARGNKLARSKPTKMF